MRDCDQPGAISPSRFPITSLAGNIGAKSLISNPWHMEMDQELQVPNTDMVKKFPMKNLFKANQIF